MTDTVNNEDAALQRAVATVRAAVRGQKPYVVGGLSEAAVKLNQNESPFDLPEALKRDLIEQFMAVPFNRYPAEQPHRLRDALAERLGRDPESVLVGNGSNELTYTLGLAFIDPGTPVVLPRPMFSLYGTMARLYGADLVEVPPRDDLSFDMDAVRAAVERHRPALTVLTTPNNPTGLALPLREVLSVLERTEGVVVVDEAYVEFTEEVSAEAVLDDYPHLILLRTFSKAAGLAGLRLGYLLGHPALMRELLKARLPFMIDRLTELTALALLERPHLLQERTAAIKASCGALTEALTALDGVDVRPSQANFVLFRTGHEPATLLRRLGDAGVLVRDMSGYPELRGYLRVNAGTEAENKAFLTALKQALYSPAA